VLYEHFNSIYSRARMHLHDSAFGNFWSPVSTLKCQKRNQTVINAEYLIMDVQDKVWSDACTYEMFDGVLIALIYINHVLSYLMIEGPESWFHTMGNPSHDTHAWHIVEQRNHSHLGARSTERLGEQKKR
jgi:hypothetical protein